MNAEHKIFSLILLIFFIGSWVYSTDIRVAWDENPSADMVTNYWVYASTNAFTFNTRKEVISVAVGTNTTATLTNMPSGPLYVAVTAQNEWLESELSDMLTVYIPESVTNIVVLPGSTNFTNWKEVLFNYFELVMQEKTNKTVFLPAPINN